MPVLEIITSHWSDWEDLGIQLWLQMLGWSSKRIKAVQRPGAHSGPFISAGLGSLAPPRGPEGLRGSLEVSEGLWRSWRSQRVSGDLWRSQRVSGDLWRSQGVSGGPGGLNSHIFCVPLSSLWSFWAAWLPEEHQSRWTLMFLW